MSPVRSESDLFFDRRQLFTFALVEVRVQAFLLEVVQLFDGVVAEKQFFKDTFTHTTSCCNGQLEEH